MKQRRFILFFIVSLMLSLCVFAENPKIRVGINYGSTCVSEATLTFENGFQAGFASDDNSFMPMMFFPENEAKVSLSDNTIIISSPEGDILFDYAVEFKNNDDLEKAYAKIEAEYDRYNNL